MNVGTEKKSSATEAKDNSLKDIKSYVSTEDTASATTTSDAEKPTDLSTAAGSATKMATETIVGSDKKAATETTAGSDTKAVTETTAEAATAINSVKLNLNTLKEAGNYIFGVNIR